MKLTFLLFIFYCLSSVTYAKDTLDVYIKTAEPFIIEEDGTYKGISLWLLERVSEEANFEYNLHETDLPDILSKLESGVCDLSINPLTITSDRIDRFNFSQPFYVGNSAIAVKDNDFEKMFATVRQFFSLDFLKVVGLLCIVIFIFGFITWLFERKANDEFGEGWVGLWHGMWWSAVTMTTVGYGDKSPRTFGGRLMAFIWMFTAIIIISGFTASITTSLTVNSLSDKLQSIDELKNFKNATITKSATGKYLNSQGIDFSDIASVNDGIESLNNDQIETFIYDEPILRYSIRRSNYEDIKVLPFKFNLQYYAFAIPKSSKLKDKLDKIIVSITESPDWKLQLKRYGLGEL